MAREVSITAQGIGTFRAASKKALLAFIESDRDYWRRKYPNGMPLSRHRTRPNGDRSFDYEEIIRQVNESPIENLNEGLISNGAFAVMPPSNTALGETFVALAESDLPHCSSALVRAVTELWGATSPPVLVTGNFGGGSEASEAEINGRLVINLASVIGARLSVACLKEQQERLQQAVEGTLTARAEAREYADQLCAFVESEKKHRSDESARFRKLRATAFNTYKSAGDGLIEEWDQKFEETYDKYVHKLQFEAPVKLWKMQADTYRKRSGAALASFVAVLIFMVSFAGMVVFNLGGSLAGKFYRNVCDSSAPLTCREVWSAEGPLAVGALLLVTSMLLWLMKIFNRTYRDAGQRAHNADERRAFVESYEAMLLSSKVPEEHRAIVLSAIFRPSIDGAPVDDSTGIDISAVSLLAKTLSGKS